MQIYIGVENKIAQLVDLKQYIVCGNSDYIINFLFDDEWNDHVAKTARFEWGNNPPVDVPFTGTQCPCPVITDTIVVKIGVYAGNLDATTPAYVMCRKSTLCGSGGHDAPSLDVYNQLMGLLDEMQMGGVSPEDIENAIAAYFEENPVEVDLSEYATTEQLNKVSEAIADHAVWFAVCNTYSNGVRLAATQSGDFKLSAGARVGVLMGYDMHGSKLNVDNTGAYPIVSAHYTTTDENGETVDVVNNDIPVIWQAHGQVIWFTFDGAYWIADSSVRATEDTVGVVTLSDKIDKVSSTTAASTTAVKTVNDRLTNALAAYIDDIAALVGGDA